MVEVNFRPNFSETLVPVYCFSYELVKGKFRQRTPVKVVGGGKYDLEDELRLQIESGEHVAVAVNACAIPICMVRVNPELADIERMIQRRHRWDLISPGNPLGLYHEQIDRRDFRSTFWIETGPPCERPMLSISGCSRVSGHALLFNLYCFYPPPMNQRFL